MKGKSELTNMQFRNLSILLQCLLDNVRNRDKIGKDDRRRGGEDVP